MNNVPCPKCKKTMTENQKHDKTLDKQRKLFPQFEWAQFICTCGYKTIRNVGKVE